MYIWYVWVSGAAVAATSTLFPTAYIYCLLRYVQKAENNGNCCKLKKVELYISGTGSASLEWRRRLRLVARN